MHLLSYPSLLFFDSLSHMTPWHLCGHTSCCIYPHLELSHTVYCRSLLALAQVWNMLVRVVENFDYCRSVSASREAVLLLVGLLEFVRRLPSAMRGCQTLQNGLTFSLACFILLPKSSASILFYYTPHYHKTLGTQFQSWHSSKKKDGIQTSMLLW